MSAQSPGDPGTTGFTAVTAYAEAVVGDEATSVRELDITAGKNGDAAESTREGASKEAYDAATSVLSGFGHRRRRTPWTTGSAPPPTPTSTRCCRCCWAAWPPAWPWPGSWPGEGSTDDPAPAPRPGRRGGHRPRADGRRLHADRRPARPPRPHHRHDAAPRRAARAGRRVLGGPPVTRRRGQERGRQPRLPGGRGHRRHQAAGLPAGRARHVDRAVLDRRPLHRRVRGLRRRDRPGGGPPCSASTLRPVRPSPTASGCRCSAARANPTGKPHRRHGDRHLHDQLRPRPGDRLLDPVPQRRAEGCWSRRRWRTSSADGIDRLRAGTDRCCAPYGSTSIANLSDPAIVGEDGPRYRLGVPRRVPGPAAGGPGRRPQHRRHGARRVRGPGPQPRDHGRAVHAPSPTASACRPTRTTGCAT